MNCYTPHTVLVTGGAGFIGCHFVRHMLRSDPHVHIVTLDLLTYAGSLDNLQELPDPSRHTFIYGDICDSILVQQLLYRYNIDTIVHFAAESHVDRSIAGPIPFIQTNVVGTLTLLEAARIYWLKEQRWGAERCRFHHISTDEVYGTLGPHDPPFHEGTPYTPNSPYAASKAASDHLVRAYHQTYELPTTTTHCSNNYGPFQHPEKFIPTILHACLTDQPIPVYGNGSNIRDWLYVEDHCAGVEAVLRRGCIGESYNIGSGREWKNIDIVHHVCRTLAELTSQEVEKFLRLIHFVPDRPGHDWRYALDTTKIREKLEWSPVESFETGIRKTVEWYLNRKAR